MIYPFFAYFSLAESVHASIILAVYTTLLIRGEVTLETRNVLNIKNPKTIQAVAVN